jgi:hypothetical protein
MQVTHYEAHDDTVALEEFRAFTPFMLDEEGAHRDRFEEIPKIESYRGFQLMADFAEIVEDARMRDLLRGALDGRGAFRRFRNALRQDARIQERWRREHDAFVEKEARDWLESLDIRPVRRYPPRRHARSE